MKSFLHIVQSFAKYHKIPADSLYFLEWTPWLGVLDRADILPALARLSDKH